MHEERIEIRSTSELDAWLASTDRSESIWLVSYKKGHPDYVSWAEIVEVLLAHGWIDSTARALDDHRSMLLIAPRRKGSTWSMRNKETVARLEAEDRMTPAGRGAIERAKADGSWSILDDVEALVVPDDLAAALDGIAGARETWESFPDSTKKQALWWVKSAKREPTRTRRIEAIAERAAEGRRPDGM